MYSGIVDLILFEAEEETSLLSANQMAGYAVTLVFTIINVAVAYFVIKKLIYKPVLKAIKAREETLNSELESAEKANAEAMANVDETKQAIEDARVKAATIIEEAKDNAESQADVIKKKAEEDAALVLERAETDAARLRKSSMEDMKDELSDLAVQISKLVLGDAVADETLRQSANKHTEELINAEVKKDE